jgi:hypothetical protein
MNTKLVEEIASAVLYEGYMLYPYRASAIKNQRRWNFGVLYPRDYAEQQSGADTWKMRTEFLVTTDGAATLEVRVRFLQIIAQTLQGQSWQGAMERQLDLPPVDLAGLANAPMRRSFSIPADEGQHPLQVAVELECWEVTNGVFQVRCEIFNTSTCRASKRDEALLCSLVSTHSILGVEGGEFVSLLEPSAHLSQFASACENVGTWPVLAGEEGQQNLMLSSPIILYDYPQIAPESPGALFDGTEIDEILALRIMTLTDAEKLEIAGGDERTRRILETTGNMPPEQFMKLHGVLRPSAGMDHSKDRP